VVSLAFRGRLLRADKSSREWLVEEEAWAEGGGGGVCESGAF